MKALVCTFNQEKALVEAFTVFVKTDGSFASSNLRRAGAGASQPRPVRALGLRHPRPRLRRRQPPAAALGGAWREHQQVRQLTRFQICENICDTWVTLVNFLKSVSNIFINFKY